MKWETDQKHLALFRAVSNRASAFLHSTPKAPVAPCHQLIPFLLDLIGVDVELLSWFR